MVIPGYTHGYAIADDSNLLQHKLLQVSAIYHIFCRSPERIPGTAVPGTRFVQQQQFYSVLVYLFLLLRFVGILWRRKDFRGDSAPVLVQKLQQG